LALITLAIGVLISILSGTLPEVPVYGDVGPAYFPQVIALALLVTGAAMLITSLLGRGKGAEKQPAEPLIQPRLVILVAITVAYILLLNRLGFLVSTPLYLIASSITFHSRHYWATLLMAVATTALLFLIFKTWLRVPLPT